MQYYMSCLSIRQSVTLCLYLCACMYSRKSQFHLTLTKGLRGRHSKGRGLGESLFGGLPEGRGMRRVEAAGREQTGKGTGVGEGGQVLTFYRILKPRERDRLHGLAGLCPLVACPSPGCQQAIQLRSTVYTLPKGLL